MERNSNVGILCALYLLSKYGTNEDVLECAHRQLGLIRRDFWTARVLAGCAPRFFINSGNLSDYLDLVRRTGNGGAERVLQFHMDVVQHKSKASKLIKYLEAKNFSFAQGIYYPKVLVALSAKCNVAFTSEYLKIYARHPALKLDPFFVKMGF
jgi:hypothetical protein